MRFTSFTASYVQKDNIHEASMVGSRVPRGFPSRHCWTSQQWHPGNRSCPRCFQRESGRTFENVYRYHACRRGDRSVAPIVSCFNIDCGLCSERPTQTTGRQCVSPIADQQPRAVPPRPGQTYGRMRNPTEVMTRNTKNTNMRNPMISRNSSLATASIAIAQNGWIMSVIMSPHA